MWNFQRSCFLALEFLKDLTKIYGIWSFVLSAISWGKVKKKEKFQAFFKKLCPQPLPQIPRLGLFSEIA